MAQATLYEAMQSFHDRWIDALEKNSRRTVDKLERDWQTINNNWDLYIQAKAEGNDSGALQAIDQIVEILGGDIDVSVLPNIGGVETELDGSESVLAVTTKIDFDADIGTTSYRLIINIHDSNGYPIGYQLGAQESDGFTITPSFAGTLTYNAKVLV